MPNSTPCGSSKSRLDAQTYRSRLLCMGKRTANKSSDMAVDLGNGAMSCEPSYKRQRVGLATQESQHYVCSSDGVMASIPKVCNEEIEKGIQMDGSRINAEDKVNTDESDLDASHDQSPPSVIQDSPKSPSADSNSPRFAEYWVPVQLTDIQLEQYCSTIITNTELLTSSKKRNLDLLQDVLCALRKCCDHPYVLDSRLQGFRKECCPSVDYLSIGIQASGKLQLLSKLLPKIREQGLRVLILYKTTRSTMKNGHGIGYILDDFICQSFGQESYVHSYTQCYVPPKEKQAAVDLINDRTSGRFVVLAEYSSYHVSIRLSSLDVVILFNSDLDPTIDIRSLHKMSLHTGNSQLRVLRLYSLFTVEEKALCMARESSAVHRIKQVISTSTCQKLVSWGAAYLFEKLDAIHASNTSESNNSSEDGFLCSVLDELSTIFSSNVDHSSTSCSVISKANEVGEGWYGNIEMHGELHVQSLDDVPPHVIWSSVLQGRSPCWRFLPNEPGYLKKRISLWDRPPEMSECLMHEEIPSWHRDTSHSAKRSKRVRACILGFQQKLQVMKRLWYNKVDKPHGKRKLERKNVENKKLGNVHHLEKELLISEICGASYRKLGRFKLDNEIQLGGVCNDMEELDAPSASIDSRILNTPESAMGTLEQPMQKMSGGDELNTENGNNLVRDVEASTESFPTESSSTCQAHEELILKNNLLISDDHPHEGSGQSTSNQFVLQEDLDIFDESLPTKEMVVAIGSDSENIYVRPVTVPELYNPIPLEDLIASDCILNEDENHAPENAASGSLLVTENQGPVTGMQSSEEFAIQSDAVKDSHDTLHEETLLADEQSSEAFAIQSNAVKDIHDTLHEETLLGNEQNSEEFAIQSDAVKDIHDTLHQETLLGNEQNSEEFAIQSDAVEDIPDALYEEILLANEQIELQESIDQIHQLPFEQLPLTPLPCSDFTVTVPSPSCEIVENDAGSLPLESPTGGFLRPDTSGQLASTVRGTEGDAQPLVSVSYGNEYPNSHQPARLDPFQSELERIENAGNVETKKLQDTVLHLKAARGKEMEQINQKYALICQNVQKDFVQKKEELKIRYEKTKAHKALADAWKLVTDENNPVSVPAPPVQINGTQTNMQPPYPLPVNQFSNSVPYQTVLPPYPPSYQNLCNSDAGRGHYMPNPYLNLYPSPLTQTNQLHWYPNPIPRPNHLHPLNFSSSTLSAANTYPQLYSPPEYLAHYNIRI